MKTLTEINQSYQSDKGHTEGTLVTSHSYLDNFYEQKFAPYRDKEINILEIGVLFGNSLKLWHDYFSNAMIYGVEDFSQKDGHSYYGGKPVIAEDVKRDLSSYNRVKLFVFNCEDTNEINKNLSNLKFDIIIDDASHHINQQLNNFTNYNKFLKPNGLYIVEDVEESLGGDNIMNHMKSFGYNSPEMVELNLSIRKDDRIVFVYNKEEKISNLVFDDYVDEFMKKTINLPYIQNGTFKSELFVLFSLHKHFNSHVFLESGLDNGMSTNTLLELIDSEYIGVDISASCEASKISKSNFKFVNADGSIYLIDCVKENQHKNFSIFIDGPKNETAIELKNRLLEFNNVNFVGIHDVYDGLQSYVDGRIMETSSDEKYNLKYFDLLNQKDNKMIDTIYTLDNNNSSRSYYDYYPSGPGLAIYSKHNINFII